MQFKSVKEFLTQTGKDAPTEAEEKLIAACRAGQECILSKTRPTSGTNANTLRAPLLRLLITGGRHPLMGFEKVHSERLRIGRYSLPLNSIFGHVAL